MAPQNQWIINQVYSNAQFMVFNNVSHTQKFRILSLFIVVKELPCWNGIEFKTGRNSVLPDTDQNHTWHEEKKQVRSGRKRTRIAPE